MLFLLFETELLRVITEIIWSCSPSGQASGKKPNNKTKTKKHVSNVDIRLVYLTKSFLQNKDFGAQEFLGGG